MTTQYTSISMKFQWQPNNQRESLDTCNERSVESFIHTCTIFTYEIILVADTLGHCSEPTKKTGIQLIYRRARSFCFTMHWQSHFRQQ